MERDDTWHDISRLDYRLLRMTNRLQEMTKIYWKMTKNFVSFKSTRTVWIHLNVLKWSLYLWFPSFHNIQMDSEWPCLFWRLRFWSSSDMPWSSSVVCRPLEDDLQSKEDDLDIRGAENIHWEKSRLMTSRSKRINSYNWILVPYIHNNCSNRGLDASVAVTVSQQ